MKCFKALILLLMAMSLISCAATQTALRYRELETGVKMSDTIFLMPKKMKKTVFIQVKNTSKYQLQFADALRQKLEAKGYTVVDDPQKANYWIQANVRYIGRMKRTAADEMVSKGYGGAIIGGTVGAVIGSNAGGSTATAVGTAVGALAGAAAEDAANTLVQVVNYSGVVDVLISERTEKPVEEVMNSKVAQGSSATNFQNIRRTGHFMRYKTRIVVSATKRNLEFQEAAPVLKDQLATCIAGIF